MPQKTLRVTFLLDGFTLKKVNEYYKLYHRFHSNLDFRGIRNWVQLQALRYFEEDYCDVEMESHYYHPYESPHDYARDREGTLRLEHELEAAGYRVHYNRRSPEDNDLGPNLSLMEDALLYAAFKKIDAVVLLSTQGQFAPLPDRLRLMGIPTLLLGWSFIYPKAKRTVHWKTDTCLRETCAHYVAMEKVVDRTPNSDMAPCGFFFQREHPFSRGRPAKWRKRQPSN